MNKSRIFSTILAFLLLPSFALAQGYTVPGSERARPRSLVDHSRTDRLTGNPNPISMPGYCPSGQVFSGGSCVLISNQNAYSPSWTSFFIGQRKCDILHCAQILADGRVQITSPGGFLYGVLSVPQENAPAQFVHTTNVGDGNFTTDVFGASPKLSDADRLTGLPPSAWVVYRR